MLINSLHTLYNVVIDKVRKVWYNIDTEREREDTTMIKRVREFFGIKEDTIKVEWMDISTILTVINVILIVLRCGVGSGSRHSKCNSKHNNNDNQKRTYKRLYNANGSADNEYIFLKRLKSLFLFAAEGRRRTNVRENREKRFVKLHKKISKTPEFFVQNDERKFTKSS